MFLKLTKTSEVTKGKLQQVSKKFASVLVIQPYKIFFLSLMPFLAQKSLPVKFGFAKKFQKIPKCFGQFTVQFFFSPKMNQFSVLYNLRAFSNPLKKFTPPQNFTKYRSNLGLSRVLRLCDASLSL